MKKIIIIILIVIATIIFNLDNIRIFLRSNLSHNSKIFIKELFFGKQYIEEIKTYRLLNYNQKALPQTQFENIELKKIKLEIGETTSSHYNAVKNTNIKSKKFFLETINENVLIFTFDGEIKIINFLPNLKIETIRSNLKNFNLYSVLGTALIEDEIFVSISVKDQFNKCTYLNILKADYNNTNLQFKKIYANEKCMTNTLGGRIVPYTHINTKGFLITTGASDKEKYLAQDYNSDFGKILFFSLDGFSKKIFSLGHRNPQGLLVEDSIILSTEHGPYGGDEINLIKFNENYGFPISSYGDTYFFEKILDKREEYEFKKNHFEFMEPIFSFVPSIGISEIIKLPENFSKYWQNDFLIASLNARSIFRISFDINFTKIKYLEKIYIGERVRDISYNSKLNLIILALEDTGSLGLIYSPNIN